MRVPAPDLVSDPEPETIPAAELVEFELSVVAVLAKFNAPLIFILLEVIEHVVHAVAPNKFPVFDELVVMLSI